MDNDRRRSVRIKKEIMAQYRDDASGTKWDMTSVKNISDSGILIITEKPFTPQTVLTLRLKLPSNPFKCLDIQGRVVTCDSSVSAAYDGSAPSAYSTRVEFSCIDEDCKKLIQDYIKWFLSKEGGSK